MGCKNISFFATTLHKYNGSNRMVRKKIVLSMQIRVLCVFVRPLVSRISFVLLRIHISFYFRSAQSYYLRLGEQKVDFRRTAEKGLPKIY